ncbi:MAG TPA: pyridoxal 5'-phosphate synthase lyase subunit PdxS, partial [Candidatus Gracilibacteria bacterium]|nr:pyridoxal 5'-phosphate synthase lyase subunit PdxS [Candidatus Gracilibacteria bacterium]
GIFKSKNPARRARAIVLATAYYTDAKKIAEASEGLGEAMFGIQATEVETRLQERGKHL